MWHIYDVFSVHLQCKCTQGQVTSISPLKVEKEITFKPLEDGDKPHPYIGISRFYSL